MLNLKGTRLKALAIHKIGSKPRNEGFLAAQGLFPVNELNQGLLEDFFLKPFRNEAFFSFTHPESLEENPVYTYARTAFQGIGTGELLDQSIRILEHLYEVSVHPNIRGGELYVAYFSDAQVEGMEADAIGIFKTEQKDIFLTVDEAEEGLQLQITEGVNTRKIDKGCLIFNTWTDEGYHVLLVNKDSEDTRFWTEDFLNLVRLQDNSYHTEAFLDMTRDFCEDVLREEEEDPKVTKLMLGQSIQYFSQNKEFDLEDFEQEVIQKPEYIERFETYRQSYEGEQGLDSREGFAISKYAVRSKKKAFKSLLKLDTEIEIHFTGKEVMEASAFVERGFDEMRGMHYYKVYFNEELE